jgi:hypothetical protein
MNNSNGHNDQLAEILDSLREWILKTEKRLAELEYAIKAKNDIDQLAERDALIAEKDEALDRAIGRVEDMLMADDGQAWKESEKALPRLKEALALKPKESIDG